MTFLNWSILAGLAAVAIPILIHLLNRRRARVVDWGAMRFLMASLASRNRRILFEEVILMALRCLAVALIVLAMARPFVPSRSTVPWAVVLPAVLVAAMALGTATVMWRQKWIRWGLLTLGVLLLAAAGATSAYEYWSQDQRWKATGDEKDVAIIIDGSMSMTLTVKGKTNFARAIQEAKAVVDACRPADAISVILAGGTARALLPSPSADRREIALKLERLEPVGGDLDVLDALNEATRTLAKGNNAGKKIVLITDGQGIGWDVRNTGRWRFLAAALDDLPTRPELICRTLALPSSFRNLAVVDLTFSRRVVGADRPVRIDAKVLNTGTTTAEAADVELTVDGEKVATQHIGELQPNAAETVSFAHRFDAPGAHVVTAQVRCQDDLAPDNASSRVIQVIRRLGVLIVEGAPSPRPLDGAASFLEIALAPRAEDADAKPAPKPPAKAKPKATDYDPDFLVAPKLVEATEVASIRDLRPYPLVILANVSRLPKAFADELAAMVRRGGGLMICPGARALPEFYNRWLAPSGQPITPALLPEIRTAPDTPARCALKTFAHPALALIAGEGRSDADMAMVGAYWKLAADQDDPGVAVAGLLDTGDPMLVERTVGKGLVLMTAMSLDRRDSNLPALKCFVPLVHEMICYLAAAGRADANGKPGGEVTIPLPAEEVGPRSPLRKLAKGDPVEVVTPSQGRAIATVTGSGEVLRLRLGATQSPGLYHLLTPGASKSPQGRQPFVLLRNPEESHLTPLTDADLASVGRHVRFFRAHTTDEMTAAASGEVPGQELWKYLAACALLALLCEIALTRWIAMQRRSHDVQPVQFADALADIQALRARAKEAVVEARPVVEVTSEP